MRFVLLSWTLAFTLRLSEQETTASPAQKVWVREGATVRLSCGPRYGPKQRWAFRRSPESRKEFISTLFRNGSVRPERADPEQRFTHTAEHLSIARLRPADSGLYLCNNRLAAVLTVSAESTDAEDSSREMKQNVTLAVLLLLCALAIVCVCLLSVTIGWKNRTNTRRPAEECVSGLELQRTAGGSWMSDVHSDAGEVQYASLAVQRWHSDTHQSSKHHVIYSTLTGAKTT